MSQTTISFILERVLKLNSIEDRISSLENKNSTLEESLKYMKSKNAEFEEKFEIWKNKFEDLSKSQKDSCIIIQELPNFELKPYQFETARLDSTEIDHFEKPGKLKTLKSPEIWQKIEKTEENCKPVVIENVNEIIEGASDFIVELNDALIIETSPKSHKIFEKRQSIVKNSNGRNVKSDPSQDLTFKKLLLQNVSIVLERIDKDPLKKSSGKAYSNSNEEKPEVLNEGSMSLNMDECQICQKNFGSFSEISNHMREHTGGRIVKIIKSVDSYKRIYTCILCSKQYFREKDLIQHHNRVHSTGQQFHKCDFCSKIFNQKYSLEIHKRIHKTSQSLTNSEENVKIKSPKPDEKPYKCPACPKILKSLDKLNLHYKTHVENQQKEFECKICFKSYRSKSILENHIRFHTLEKPLYKHNRQTHGDTSGDVKGSRKSSSNISMKK